MIISKEDSHFGIGWGSWSIEANNQKLNLQVDGNCRPIPLTGIEVDRSAEILNAFPYSTQAFTRNVGGGGKSFSIVLDHKVDFIFRSDELYD